MKKYSKFIAIFAVALFLTACSRQVNMDQPDANGNYDFSDSYLGFSLILPKEFDHYQFQRVDKADYSDLEFFVPTSDTSIPKEVPGYGEPIIVRVYNKSAWDGSDQKNSGFVKIGEKGDKVYAMEFWQKIPKDWQSVWNDNMKNEIKNSFKIN